MLVIPGLMPEIYVTRRFRFVGAGRAINRPILFICAYRLSFTTVSGRTTARTARTSNNGPPSKPRIRRQNHDHCRLRRYRNSPVFVPRNFSKSPVVRTKCNETSTGASVMGHFDCRTSAIAAWSLKTFASWMGSQLPRPRRSVSPLVCPPTTTTRSILCANSGCNRIRVARLVSGPRARYVSRSCRRAVASPPVAAVGRPKSPEEDAPAKTGIEYVPTFLPKRATKSRAIRVSASSEALP